MAVQIDKNIPIPKVESAGRTPRYSFGDLKNAAEGHSYLELATKREDVKRIQRAAASYARRAGIKLVTRYVEERSDSGVRKGVRIWRA